MAKINTMNYQTVAAWNGTQDLFVVEQPDGTKVATPEQVKQYVLNDMDEEPTQDSENPVMSGGTKTYVDNAVSTGLSELSSVIDTKKVRTVRLNKNQSATISANISNYWAMLAVCYIPGEGGRILGFVFANGTGEVKNLCDGNAFSSSYVDFTFSATSLTVTAKNYNGYVFTFIVTPNTGL